MIQATMSCSYVKPPGERRSWQWLGVRWDEVARTGLPLDLDRALPGELDVRCPFSTGVPSVQPRTNDPRHRCTNDHGACDD